MELMQPLNLLPSARYCRDPCDETPAFEVPSIFLSGERTLTITSTVQAVTEEQMDILVMSAASGLELPKHVYDIIADVKTSILIFRSQSGPGSS